MRAQLRVPLWKDVRSYFSLGECTRSSSSAKPTSSESMPSTSRKSPTIGIEPPDPMVTAFLPHSAASAARALASAGFRSEADEQRIHAQHFAEVADDRDRAARPDGDRLLAPFGGERGARLGQRRVQI